MTHWSFAASFALGLSGIGVVALAASTGYADEELDAGGAAHAAARVDTGSSGGGNRLGRFGGADGMQTAIDGLDYEFVPWEALAVGAGADGRVGEEGRGLYKTFLHTRVI